MRYILFIILLMFSLLGYGKGAEDGTIMPFNPGERERYYEEFDKMRKGMSEEEFRKKMIEELKYINRLNKQNMKLIRAPSSSGEIVWIEDTETKRVLKKRDKAFIYYIMDYTLYEKPDMEIVNLLQERVNKITPYDTYFSNWFLHIGEFQYYVYMISLRDVPLDEKVDYLINEMINNYVKNPTKHAGAWGILESMKEVGRKGIERMIIEFEKHLKDEDESCNGISMKMKSIIQRKGIPEDMDRLSDIVKKSDIPQKIKERILKWIEWGKKEPFPYKEHFGNYKFPYEKFFKNYKEF